MEENKKPAKEKFDVRHELAIQRTILTNERTLLAYSRTSLTLVIPGLTFYHFTDAENDRITVYSHRSCCIYV